MSNLAYPLVEPAETDIHFSHDYEISRSVRIHESDHYARVGDHIKAMDHRPGLNPYAPTHWPLLDQKPVSVIEFKLK